MGKGIIWTEQNYEKNNCLQAVFLIKKLGVSLDKGCMTFKYVKTK